MNVIQIMQGFLNQLLADVECYIKYKPYISPSQCIFPSDSLLEMSNKK